MAGWASMSCSKFVLFPKDSLVCLYISVIQFLLSFFFFFFPNTSKATLRKKKSRITRLDIIAKSFVAQLVGMSKCFQRKHLGFKTPHSKLSNYQKKKRNDHMQVFNVNHVIVAFSIWIEFSFQSI